MEFLLLLIGSIFLTIGTGIIVSFIRFKNHGEKIVGKVKCLEKFIAKSRSNHSGQTSSMMYATVVEYPYQQQNRLVRSIASNQIRHQPGQKLSVLVIKSPSGEIRAKIDDKANYFFGGVFALIGLICSGIYPVIEDGSMTLTLISITVAIIIGSLFTRLIRKSNIPFHSVEDNQNLREDATIIQTQEEYEAECGRYYFWGKIIAFVFGLIGFGLLVWGYQKTGTSQFELGELQSLLLNPGELIAQIKAGSLARKWHAPLSLMGMGAFFVLTSLHSYFYQRRKFGQ